MRKALLTAVIACLPSLCFAGQPLSDDQAKKVIEEYWSAAFLHVPLGTFTVVDDDSQGTPNAIPRAQLERWYKPLEETGLIRIVQDADTPSITVTATSEGKARNGSKNPEMLAVSYGAQSIDTIVADKAIDPGHAAYQVFNVGYSVKWDDAVARVLTVCEKPVTPKQKALVLLKYDPADGDWKVAAEDDANADDAFCTQDVASTLGAVP